MANLSDYLENALLGWVRGTAFPAAPGTVYLALYTTAPTDAGGGVEVSGGGYARQPIPWGPLANPLANSTPITYPDATAGWGTVVAVGIFDAASGGNLLWHGALAANRTVDTGERFVFDAGQLTISVG